MELNFWNDCGIIVILGSDKVKSSRKKKEEVVSGSMEESKRASSLDSVNVRDMGRGMRYVETISTSSSSSPSKDRQRSSSDQGLKVRDRAFFLRCSTCPEYNS